jgi:glycosyltransferase involved in cell wall biosynthesis
MIVEPRDRLNEKGPWNTMFDASVAICAHNPRPNYLGRVLESLRNQTLSPQRWEFFLIDNASQTTLSSAWDISWHPNGRHIVETELGLASARRRAMKEASSDVLIFVDDDNILDPSYIARVIEIKRDWPLLGVWGSGKIIPEFEVAPGENVKPLVQYLALREVSTAKWSNVPTCIEATPWGAGLCVRSNVAAVYNKCGEQSSIQITGRRGNILLSGEDVEMAYLSCKMGLGIGIFPELKVTHLIPKERVAEEYLVRIFEGTAISDLLLAFKWRAQMPWSPLSAWGMLSMFKNVLLRRGIDRRMYLANVRAAIKARRIILSSAAQREGSGKE